MRKPGFNFKKNEDLRRGRIQKEEENNIFANVLESNAEIPAEDRYPIRGQLIVINNDTGEQISEIDNK